MSWEAILLVAGFDDAFDGVLDPVSEGIESAWSVGRRLLGDYTGPVIRVRRSTDSAESDFRGTGLSGAVSSASVEAFCGAGSGYLTTIYDQSGNGRHLVQSTAILQPLVVNAGVALTQNGNLWAQFVPADSTSLSVPSSTAVYNFVHDGTSSTIYLVASPNDTAGNVRVIGNIAGTSQRGMRLTFTNLEQLRIEVVDNNSFAVNVLKAGTAGLNIHTISIDANNVTAASREATWRDSVLLGTDNASTGTIGAGNATNSMSVGVAGANYYDGHLGEIVFWSQDQAANRSIWESSAQSFWGTP